MYLMRGFTVWLLIIFAESIHGTIRQLLLAPVVGDFTARRISFFVAVLLIFLITYFSIRWINAPNVKSLFVIGLIWTVLMTLFEFGLGIFVMNYSWERMLEDYDLTRGGLMGFGLLFMFFAPFLAAKIRAFRKAKQEI
jgi:hypothetical protein